MSPHMHCPVAVGWDTVCPPYASITDKLTEFVCVKVDILSRWSKFATRNTIKPINHNTVGVIRTEAADVTFNNVNTPSSNLYATCCQATHWPTHQRFVKTAPCRRSPPVRKLGVKIAWHTKSHHLLSQRWLGHMQSPHQLSPQGDTPCFTMYPQMLPWSTLWVLE